MKRLEETFVGKIFEGKSTSSGIVQALIGGTLLYVASRKGLYSPLVSVVGNANLILGMSIVGYNWVKKK